MAVVLASLTAEGQGKQNREGSPSRASIE
jgi:hypothetical protein